MTAMIQNAKVLLDFEQKLDIGLLDNVVNAMFGDDVESQRIAQEVLTTLQDHPDAWTRVDAILEFSSNEKTRYYALQILEKLISTRWKMLPRNQCEGIKKYIVNLIIKKSSDPSSLRDNKVCLNKLNLVLVEILKREWPKHWESFITDIVGASNSNESLCQNNMVILKLMSEELFDFSSGKITQTRIKHLKDSMCNEFSQVFHLCLCVLEKSQNAQLVEATLETLLRFLNWIPLGFIFETNIIELLVMKFLNVPMFRNLSLSCLTEIASIKTPHYNEMFKSLFTNTMATLERILPLNTDIRTAYSHGTDQEQNFIQNLAMFLNAILRHRQIIENDPKSVNNALNYLILISQVNEEEIFKICLDYWSSLTAELYQEGPITVPLANFDMISRRSFYFSILSRLRAIMISRMARPEEVLIVQTESGEVVREFMKDTDAINLYKSMRETLVYLTHLDCLDTEKIMTEKLQNQVNGTEWSWNNLNTLCWAVGSISGAMHEEDEKRFLVTVIKDLLGLCEQKKGKDNKAIIASNIMYVVGQYPRFLRAHWKFLKTVVNKLFEFMHESHEGVQDMACDTFIKIANKCRRHFIVLQIGEAEPYIEEILRNITSIICDLQEQQTHTFYEALGYMISAQTDDVIQKNLICECMSLLNSMWDTIISKATKDVETLKDQEVVKRITFILRTNIHVCKAIGHPYVYQLCRIYLDLLNVYKMMSGNVINAISTNGENVHKQPLIKSMCAVKKDTLRLISEFVSKTITYNVIMESFMPPLMNIVLLDYQTTPFPVAREPQVLSTMTAIINRLEAVVAPEVPKIFNAVFDCTLDMINKNYEEYPEHRTNFFLLIQAVNYHCFISLLNIPTEQFKLVFDSIIWAIQHTMRNVADTGLQILHELILNVVENEQVTQTFFKMYLIKIIEHVFGVVTDTSHTASLTMHATILSCLFTLLEKGKIKVQLDPSCIDNKIFVQQYIANLLKRAFPHLTDYQIKITTQGMFNLNHNVLAFKEHLRDFLIQIREFTGEDDSDLYLEERERELEAAQQEKWEIQKSVPGIINPHEMEEMD